MALNPPARGSPTLTVSRIRRLSVGVDARTDGVEGWPTEVKLEAFACGPSMSAPLVSVTV